MPNARCSSCYGVGTNHEPYVKCVHCGWGAPGVLVEDGLDGEPTAEQAIGRVLRDVPEVHEGTCWKRVGATGARCACGLDAALAVLRRSIEKPA
jgi:hypothetical protein